MSCRTSLPCSFCQIHFLPFGILRVPTCKQIYFFIGLSSIDLALFVHLTLTTVKCLNILKSSCKFRFVYIKSHVEIWSGLLSGLYLSGWTKPEITSNKIYIRVRKTKVAMSPFGWNCTDQQWHSSPFGTVVESVHLFTFAQRWGWIVSWAQVST